MDEVSFRSSKESNFNRPEERKNDDIESEASTIGDFVPREVKKLQKEIVERGEGRAQAIVQTKVQFNDPELKSLLSVVPLAYDKMAQLPYEQYATTHQSIKQSVHKIEALLEQIKFVSETGDGMRQKKD